MIDLPYYLGASMILTALATLLFLYKATSKGMILLCVSLAWSLIQALLSLKGFYTVTNGVPPRFGLLLIPPVIFIIILFSVKAGAKFIASFDAATLTLMHTVRLPVELILYGLYISHKVPLVMTFEGRNFDIICGLTAPFVYYFGFVKRSFNKTTLITWNILCLLLLANIVVTAVLSAPFTFQKFGFEQPNIALLYFPFVWLPCFIVPAVLFAHLASIRQLIK